MEQKGIVNIPDSWLAKRVYHFIDIIRREFDRSLAMGAEIGVSRGQTSAALLRAFPDLTLVMVDAWAMYPPQHPYRRSGDGHSKLTAEQQAEHKRTALDATDFAADRRVVMHTTSFQASWAVPDGSLDFCLLDGDHTFGAVMLDLHQWWPKLRPGGLMLGDDWRHPRDRRGLFGVEKAVRRFAEKYGLAVRSERDKWWYEPRGGAHDYLDRDRGRVQRLPHRRSDVQQA